MTLQSGSRELQKVLPVLTPSDVSYTRPPTVVTTALGLQQAVLNGDPFIEIQDHLDLTSLDTVTCDEENCLLGLPSSSFIPSTVRSIRVRCLAHRLQVVNMCCIGCAIFAAQDVL